VVDDHRNHPLHHVYRKRIRGIRMRWFGSGLVLGMIAGILLTLIVSAVVVTQIPEVVQTFSGEPDVAVVIGEGYLNREAAARLATTEQQASSNLALTAVTIDIQPGNRMDLKPTFKIDLFLTTVDISPAVRNQLSVENGELVLNMVGDPQLGDLNLPLGALPFDLDSEIRSAVNRINNDLLMAQINTSLHSGFGSEDFIVEGVTTNASGMTVRLQHP
jgi:hypothetical protein